jgi:hypothetical protein
MVQRGQRLRLLRKAFREPRVTRALGRQQLQCDRTVQRFLPRFINDAHAAASEAFEDLELRKMWRDFLRREWRQRRAVNHGRLNDLRHQTSRAHAAFRQYRTALPTTRVIGQDFAHY